MNKSIQPYQRNNHWYVRVYSTMLIGKFETRRAALKHGEWYLATQGSPWTPKSPNTTA